MAASPSSAQNSQGFGSKTFEHQGSAEKRTLRNQGNSDPPSISVYRVQCFLPLPVYDQQKDLHTASFNSVYYVYVLQFATLYRVRRSATQFLHVDTL